MKIHIWLYHHARWFFKWASGYCYEFNCEVEELRDEVERLIKMCEENQEVNRIIKERLYETI